MQPPQRLCCCSQAVRWWEGHPCAGVGGSVVSGGVRGGLVTLAGSRGSTVCTHVLGGCVCVWVGVCVRWNWNAAVQSVPAHRVSFLASSTIPSPSRRRVGHIAAVGCEHFAIGGPSHSCPGLVGCLLWVSGSCSLALECLSLRGAAAGCFAVEGPGGRDWAHVS
jgi:hypothetical protein